MSERLIPGWIDGNCEVAGGLYEFAGALYDSWRAYAHTRGEEPGSPAEFAEAMERRGFVWDRIPPLERRRVRWGVRLR